MSTPAQERKAARIAEVLSIHRWKTMGVDSVECECGAILLGAPDPFPADAAFRQHIARVIIELPEGNTK